MNLEDLTKEELTIITIKLNKLRKDYEVWLNEGNESKKSRGPTKVPKKRLREIYGENLDSPLGCVKILYNIFQAGNYIPRDPVFITVDGEFHSMAYPNKRSKSNNPLKYSEEEINIAIRVYERLTEVIENSGEEIKDYPKPKHHGEKIQ